MEPDGRPRIESSKREFRILPCNVAWLARDSLRKGHGERLCEGPYLMLEINKRHKSSIEWLVYKPVFSYRDLPHISVRD